jgi:hypothetical protein
MTALEQIMQLKGQGMPDDQIISTLQQQGITPNEINTALSQAEIKNAVTAEQGAPAQMPTTQEIPAPTQDQYAQAPAQEQYAQPEQVPAGQEEYYPQEGYDQSYAPQGGGFDSNTIMEIAEQVFSEKTKKIEKQLSELSEFKTMTQTKIENIDERLKKIESMIDKLQITILEKIGSYGQNLGEIKKEMGMMQDSFGKMINPIADKSQSISPVAKKVAKKKVSK